MSDFGDLTDDDVVDTDTPDPEALARLFYVIRHELAPDKKRKASLDDEPELIRVLMIFVFAAIIEKLKREWLR